MGDVESQILEFLEEGLFLYGVGRTQEAVSRWKKVLELDPGNERAMDYIRTAGIDPATLTGGGAAASSEPPPPEPPAPEPSVPPEPPAQQARPPSFQPPPSTQSAPPSPPPPPAEEPFGGDTRSGKKPIESSPEPPLPQPPPAQPPAAHDTARSAVPPPPEPGPPPQPPPPQPPPGPAASDAPAVQSADDRKRAALGVVAEHYKKKDLEGAFQALEGICNEFPNDEALDGYLNRLKGEMTQQYSQTLGSMDRIPQLSVSQNDLMGRQLSPEEGFVISRIDGSGTIEDLLTVLGLDRFTGLRTLHRLHQAGLIVFV